MKRRHLLLPLALLASLLPGAATSSPAQADDGVVVAGSPLLSGIGELETRVWTSWDRSYVPSAMFSAPVVGDVTGDGVPEVVTGFPNGHLYVWTQDGRLLVDHPVSSLAVQATVSLADINADGVADIVGGTLSGRVFGYTAKGGTLGLLFSKQLAKYNGLNGVYSSPTVADIDRDGKVEIIMTSWQQDLNVWSPNGSSKPGFPIFLKGTSWASPAVADLDGDGYKDIVVGSDRNFGNPDPAGGFVQVFDHRGRVRPGWPKYNNRTVWSSPSVGDVDGDGRKDIVVGTGPYPGADKVVLAYNRNGNVLPGWPVKVNEYVLGAPAIGDIDQDGRTDVAFMDTKNRLYVVDRFGKALPGWPRCSDNAQTCTANGGSAPSLADVTGDGLVDVVSAGQNTIWIRNARGQVQSSLVQRGPLSAVPTIASINGRATILMTTRRPSGTSQVGKVLRFTTGAALGPTPWPKFKQNTTGTSVASDNTPPTAPIVRTSFDGRRVYLTGQSTDVGSRVSTFEAWVKDGTTPNFRLTAGAPSTVRDAVSATRLLAFTTIPGHQYLIQVRARDGVGNVGPWGYASVTGPLL